MTHPDSDVGEFAVATHGLSKRYGRKLALDEVELRVPEGSVYVLVGVNGAGKSTLFKTLMNLERPDTGAAEVFGLDTGGSGPEVRAQIGYVPERQEAPYRYMSCARLLRHAAAFYPAWDHAYADHLARALGVPPEQRVGGLSKGETRRLQLVMALAHRPALLLFDEPMDGLDPLVRRRALALLAEHLADAPTTVVISTHHVQELESLADHVGVLRGGRLVAQMSRDDLQRTVRTYELEAPEGWEVPKDLHATALRRSSTGRDMRCTLVGEERDITGRLLAAGARVRGSSTLALEDAALAFLPEEPS
ncbi:MAG: ABC transporter ATP-binding protein [Gemmatimonadota bacterium]